MRCFAGTILLASMILVGHAAAQEFGYSELEKAAESDYGDLAPSTSMTPETWMHLQEYRKQEDPKTLIFRRAQERAESRRRRLESMAWFGYSNQRPVVHAMPLSSGSYSPFWGGNAWDPYRWSGVGATYVVIYRTLAAE